MKNSIFRPSYMSNIHISPTYQIYKPFFLFLKLINLINKFLSIQYDIHVEIAFVLKLRQNHSLINYQISTQDINIHLEPIEGRNS